jgi:hypothetical protein
VFIVTFIKNQGAIICLYVDDMLIFGTDYDSIVNTKNFLSSNFDMKDLGVDYARFNSYSITLY